MINDHIKRIMIDTIYDNKSKLLCQNCKHVDITTIIGNIKYKGTKTLNLILDDTNIIYFTYTKYSKQK